MKPRARDFFSLFPAMALAALLAGPALAAPAASAPQLAQSSTGLPAEVKRDLLVTKIAQAMKAGNWPDVLRLVGEYRALGGTQPASLDYIEGKALLRTKKPKAAMAAFDRYLTGAGKDGKYYKRALKARVEAEGAVATAARDREAAAAKAAAEREAQRKKAEAEARRRKAAAEARRRKVAADVRRKKAAVEARRKRAAEEVRRKAVEEARIRTLAPGQSFRQCAECPVLVVIPAGSFLMGSTSGNKNARPQHQVQIEKFALGKYEVTVGEFAAFVKASGYQASKGCYETQWPKTAGGVIPVWHSGWNWRYLGFSQRGRHPAGCLRFKDVKAYVGWLSGQTGQRYRLASEAEWEYAARAGTTTARYWGDDSSCRYENLRDLSARKQQPRLRGGLANCRDGYFKTAPVGRFRPNQFGLHDMLGNIMEWVEDCWNADYRGAPTSGQASSSGDCTHRVLRGASWATNWKLVRSAERNQHPVKKPYPLEYVGFRVARSLR